MSMPSSQRKLSAKSRQARKQTGPNLPGETPVKVQASQQDLALHTLGWKLFQDLCAHVLEVAFNSVVEVYREAQDGGQDAVFLHRPKGEKPLISRGSAQCKFTGKADAHLRPSDLTEEIAAIKSLIIAGEASSYVLMTNAKVSAPTASYIKRQLRSLGVKFPYVLGKEFIQNTIRANSRLRALIPRVYGLGDLSTILDERQASQTSLLLGHMLPTLSVYVATTAHQKAVKSLVDYGIVLLLGNAATGKSSIAAILSTIALEDPRHRCFKVDNPNGLIEIWNPSDGGGFYWIDDAFGPNSLQEDFVNAWMMTMPKIQAAISCGNRFVLTSRRHIYEAAKFKLGQRNHPRFLDDKAVISVDSPSKEEKAQILYNHMRAGKQPSVFKAVIKRHADQVTNLELIPEVCRRLADPIYTKGVWPNIESIVEFVQKPKQHLVETVRCLAAQEWAALVLLFLHQGLMPVTGFDADISTRVLESFNVSKHEIGTALAQLRGSFIRVGNDLNSLTFQHPTISDAISEILMKTAGMGLFFILGARQSAVLGQVSCTNAPFRTPDTILVSKSEEPYLMQRLRNLPDDYSINALLFGFLATRSSNEILLEYNHYDAGIFSRKHYYYSSGYQDSRLDVASRLFRLNALRSEDRNLISNEIRSRVLDLDLSLLEDDRMLELLEPKILFVLKDELRSETVPGLVSQIESLSREADEDCSPGEHFQEMEQNIEILEKLIAQHIDQTGEQLQQAREAIDEAEADLRSLIAQKEEERAWKWSQIEEASSWPKRRAPSPESPRQTSTFRPRSLFDDMDT